MKKIFLMVELTDENGGHVYAIQYTGVMTRRNIYAKLTQNTGCPEPEYIKVSKQETVDKTEERNSVFSGRVFRHIQVAYAFKKIPRIFLVRYRHQLILMLRKMREYWLHFKNFCSYTRVWKFPFRRN